MKDYDAIILILIGVLFATALYTAYITILKKTLTATQPKEKIHDSRRMLYDQKRRMKDNEARQKQMMYNQKQRIKDLQRMQNY